MNRRLTDRVEELIHNFEKLPGIKDGNVEVVREAIETSPELAERMDLALQGGRLRTLKLLPETDNNLGIYDRRDGSVSIHPSVFREKNQIVRIDRLTYILGHETEHAILRDWNTLRHNTFHETVVEKTSTDLRYQDYTPESYQYLRDVGANEVLAEVGGWNALQSRLKHLNPDSRSLKEDMIKRADKLTDCVSGTPPKLQSGLHLESDGSMRLGPGNSKNVEPLYACHFDGFGIDPESKNKLPSAYRNHYGVTIIESIAAAHRNSHNPPEALLNLKKLGLDHDTLQRNGVDLGGPGRTFSYVEIDDRGRPIAYRQLKQAEHSPTITATPKSQTEQPAIGISTADAPLFDALRQRLPPETSPDRLAQIAVAARLGGVTAGNLQAVDVDGQRLHVVSTVPGLRGSVDLGTAPPPQAESLQQLQQHNHQHALERSRQAEREANQAAMDPAR